MPYAKRRRTTHGSKKRFSRKRKSVSRKRTYRRPTRKSGPRRSKKSVRKSVKSRLPCDAVGARFLSATATDPNVLGMYRSAIQAGTSLTSVHVKARTAIADVYTCKFKYGIDDANILPGTNAANAFYGNAIVDSGRTLDNQNCAYVAELGQLYLYYRVTSSRCTFHLDSLIGPSDPAVTATQPITAIMYCTIIPPANWTTALPITLEGWMVSGVPHKVITITNTNTDGQVKKMSMFMKTSALFNSDSSVEDFTGNMPNTIIPQSGTVPAAAFQWYWGIAYFNYNGSAASVNDITINVSIEYWTTLDGPVTAQDYTPGPAPDAESILPKKLEPVPIVEDLEESVYVKLPKSALKKT